MASIALVDFGLLGRKEQGDSLQHHLLVESGQDTEAAAIRVATVRIAEDFLTKGKTAIISVGKS